MKRQTLIVLAGLAIAYPAYAETVGEKTGVNKMLGIAPTAADFAREAAISDMFEIQSSQLAETKGDDASKAFATQMVTDHQKTTDELKSLVQAGKLQTTLPTQMDSAHQKMLDKLNGLNGADFTKEYDSDQVSAHKDAVSLFRRYGKGGKNAPLKDWASKTLPTLEHHLQMAQGLKG